MFNNIKIEVKDFVLKNVGIVINKKESISYVIPRSIPFEISHKQIIFFSYKNFTLYFKDENKKKDFLNQIGIQKVD